MRVVVIGSGVLGLTTAYFLKRRGLNVCVLDSATGAGLQTSFANGGLLTSSMADPWNSPGVVGQVLRSIGRPDSPLLVRARALPSLLGWGLRFLRESSPARHDRNTLANVRLAIYSRMSLDALRAETGLQFGHRETGSLRVFRNEKGFEQARRRAAWLGQHGIASKVLDAPEVVSLEGALADIQDQLLGGIYYPDDSIGDTYIFCEQLAAHLSRQNVELRYGILVRDFKCDDRRIQAVVTSDGDVSGDAFVVSAGVASQKLAKQAGIDLSVRPVKGYSISCPGVDTRNPRVPVIDDALHAVVTPLPGILRAAGTAEFSGQDLGIPVARVDNLRRLLQRIYPWANSSVPDAALRAWAGLRAVSADGVPIVGRTTLENLYVNTGHGHLGWTLAAGSASLLAQMMSQESSSVDTRPYDPSRFD